MAVRAEEEQERKTLPSTLLRRAMSAPLMDDKGAALWTAMPKSRFRCQRHRQWKIQPGNTSEFQAIAGLKFHLSVEQMACRKARFASQGFADEGYLWRGVLLSDDEDAAIAQELGMAFTTRELRLPDLDAAILWVLQRGLSNPQLNSFQRIRARLQQKDLLLAVGRAKMAAAAKGLTGMSNLDCHISRRHIAKAAHSSEGQVSKVERLLASASAEVLARLERGELKIGTAFNALGTPNLVPPGRTYDVILFDPPTGIGRKRLREIPLGALAAENAVLFCWSHPRDLVMTLSLIRRAGFSYVTQLVLPLEKPMVQTFVQEAHDVLLLSVRRKPATPAVEDLPSTVLEGAGGRDRPASVFELIEDLFPKASKVQVLPRATRTGWDEWDLTGCRTPRDTSIGEGPE